MKSADLKQVDPTSWNQKNGGTQNFTLMATNQNCAWSDYVPCSPLPHITFNTFPWKASGSFGLLSIICPFSLLGALW